MYLTFIVKYSIAGTFTLVKEFLTIIVNYFSFMIINMVTHAAR